jgi:hypothetical protein
MGVSHKKHIAGNLAHALNDAIYPSGHIRRRFPMGAWM